MLGNPQNDFPSIHLAGTNGKGSTANMLASVFQQAGYKTGLYTSPHLVDFRERIRINGAMISEQAVIEFVNQYADDFIPIKPSFFEITFAMAIDYFRSEKVDVVIMETGMGGRLDSTNVVKSIMSIITNIGLDHTAFLGNTLPAIASEKAGIIKHQIPVIIGERQAECEAVFINKAKALDAELFFAEDRVVAKFEGDNNSKMAIQVDGKLWAKIDFPLHGNYQKYNLQTAMAALLLLSKSWDLPKQTIIEGLEQVLVNTSFAGRWQIIQQRPRIIADTGHNVEGLKLSMAQIASMQFNQLHFVVGMVNDKDIDKVLTLLPKDGRYYFCKANIPRALEVDILFAGAQKNGLNGQAYSSVAEAYLQAKANMQDDDLLFVGGSTFVVAEVLELIGKKEN
jgi:dihydrofolate synthase/folylpolyglutamate synthase